MAKKPTSSISITFVSPVESTGDTSQIKAAYEDLRQQIASLHESIQADPNVVIAHSRINTAGETPSLEDPVDTKIAELQTINAKVAQGKTPSTNPVKTKTVIREDDEGGPVEETEYVDKPHITQHVWVPPVKKVAPPPVPEAGITPATSAPTKPSQKSRIEEAIFKNLKKSAKSSAIINFMLDNMDKELTLAQIAEGSEVDNKAVSIWLGTTAKDSIKAIKNVGRGVYIFNSDKIKLKD